MSANDRGVPLTVHPADWEWGQSPLIQDVLNQSDGIDWDGYVLASARTIHAWARNYEPLMACILFGGDRAACCEFGLLAEGDTPGDVVAAATFSLRGEDGSGPAIVGLLVRKDWRRRGVGTRLMEMMSLFAVHAPGYVYPDTKVRVDLYSDAATAMVRGLAPDVKARLSLAFANQE